jgi:hypothetical protein
MNPRTFDTFVLLSGLVCSRPIALCVKPQSGKRLRESGWRLGCDKGLAEVVQSYFKSPYLMTPMGRDRAATATTAGRAVVLVAMEAATVVAMIVAVMILAIMMFIVLVMLMSMLLLLPMPMLLLLFLMLLLLLVVLSLLLPSASFRMRPQTNTSAIRKYLPIMIGQS